MEQLPQFTPDGLSTGKEITEEKKDSVSKEISESNKHGIEKVRTVVANTNLSIPSKDLIEGYDSILNAYILKKPVDQSYRKFVQENEADLAKFILETGENEVSFAYEKEKKGEMRKGEMKKWVATVENLDGVARIKQVADSSIQKVKENAQEKTKYQIKQKGGKSAVYPQKSIKFNPKTMQYEKQLDHVQHIKLDPKEDESKSTMVPINSMLAINQELIKKFGTLPYPFVNVVKSSSGSEIQENAGMDLYDWMKTIPPDQLPIVLDQYQDQIFKTCLDANCYLSQINYAYGDQKAENICIENGKDGTIQVKIIDYGQGALFDKEGKILPGIDRRKDHYDHTTRFFITREDKYQNGVSQQTRAVPVTAALMIDQIGKKYYHELLVQDNFKYLDVEKTLERINEFVEKGYITDKDYDILELAYNTIIADATERPTPEKFRSDYLDILKEHQEMVE